LHLDARLWGPKLTVETLMTLAEGDILEFDFARQRPLDLFVNGKLKYRGEIVNGGRKRAFAVQELVHE
jgi:flagellar motor switch/type III secretory pathway protein FliN